MTGRDAMVRAAPFAVFAAGAAVLIGLYVQQRRLPVNALRAQSAIAFSAPASPEAIIDAIAESYGVYVNFEYPNEPGGEPSVLPKMQPSAEVGDSLKAFFDSIEKESDGLLTGTQIGGSLCIVPKQRLWREDRSNLDRIIGATLEGMTAADALYSISTAVNQYSVGGYPLRLNPGGFRAGFVPPEAFRTEPAVPLDEDEISAREAVCRVLADFSIPNVWVYGHSRGEAYLTVRFYEDGKVIRRKGTPRERLDWTIYTGAKPNS